MALLRSVLPAVRKVGVDRHWLVLRQPAWAHSPRAIICTRRLQGMPPQRFSTADSDSRCAVDSRSQLPFIYRGFRIPARIAGTAKAVANRPRRPIGDFIVIKGVTLLYVSCDLSGLSHLVPAAGRVQRTGFILDGQTNPAARPGRGARLARPSLRRVRGVRARTRWFFSTVLR
jgi:hypothetical protein